jgi:hypothetical protein
MQRDPEDARLVVRHLNYGNHETENEAIRMVDDIIFSKVAQVESNAVQRGHQLMDSGRMSITAASEIADELEQLRLTMQNLGGRPIDPATAEAFEVLRNKGRAAQQRLSRHVLETEHLAKTCENPFDAYVKMTRRFSMLRPNLPF